MRKPKPRNAFVAPESDFIDLGVLNMTPTIATEQSEPESEPETNDPDSDKDQGYQTVRLEIMEPKNWVRNRVIVRNS